MGKIKTVLITGGNKGIGFATAKLFAENGYNVILAGRNKEHLKNAVESIGKEKCSYVLWNCGKVDDIEPAIKSAHSIFGNIDIFVNNAGIVTDDIFTKSFFEKEEEPWDEIMNVNLKGVFFAVQKEAKYMLEHNIKGNIVNVCSEMGFRGACDAYAVSKWGVRGLTEGLGKLLAEHSIVLNGIAPGETATEIIKQKEGEIKKIDSPRGIQASPREIAEGIYFLARSRNIIGETLISDGGRRIK